MALFDRPSDKPPGDPPRLARMDIDFWCLRSAEESHRRSPETFWIPPAEDRDSLRIGQAAKLIFDQEGIEESGEVAAQGERMWVLVTARVGNRYLGVLDSEPRLMELTDEHYLRRGVEVAFDSEHVVDIGDPSAEYVEARLQVPPTKRWG